MNLVHFPETKEKIYLKDEELKQLNSLIKKLKQTTTPGEANYYKMEIDSIIFTAKARIN